jgi:hypothetical protein
VTFGNPLGFIGLLSLPVILALHLLFKRQEHYVVSHLGLWSFLNSELQGPRSHRIPLTWILLLDLLVAALFSLAWAQPRISLPWTETSPRHHIILLDVSSSMRAIDNAAPGQPARFDRARDKALELLGEARPNDAVTVVTFGRQARVIADSRRAGGQAGPGTLAARIRLAAVGETGSGALREALALGQAALEPALIAEYHIVTDGSLPAESLAELDRFPHPLHWHFVGEPAANQAVIDLAAAPLDEGRYQVFARIANFSETPAGREVVLAVDGRPVSRDSLSLPAGTSVARVWAISADPSRGSVEVTVALGGTDSLAEDDSAAASLHGGGAVRVGLVVEDPAEASAGAQPPAALRQAVQAIPSADLEVISAHDYATRQAGGAASWDLAIFYHTLPASWPLAPALVIDPPVVRDEDAAGVVDLYARSRVPVPAGAPVHAPRPNPYVEGIDFAGVRWASAWELENAPTGFETLLAAGDVPLLLGGEIDPGSPQAGQALVLTADLARGNFTRHPAFPILIANLVEAARQAPLPSAFQTGEALPLPVTGGTTAVQVVPPGDPAASLQPPWPPAWTDTLDPGFYQFRLDQANGETVEFSAGARVGDAQESDLRTRAAIQLSVARDPARAADPSAEKQHVDLQAPLLSTAFLLLLVEAFLAWRR